MYCTVSSYHHHNHHHHHHHPLLCTTHQRLALPRNSKIAKIAEILKFICNTINTPKHLDTDLKHLNGCILNLPSKVTKQNVSFSKIHSTFVHKCWRCLTSRECPTSVLKQCCVSRSQNFTVASFELHFVKKHTFISINNEKN